MSMYRKALRTSEELRNYVFMLPLPESELEILWDKIVEYGTDEWNAGIESEDCSGLIIDTENS